MVLASGKTYQRELRLVLSLIEADKKIHLFTISEQSKQVLTLMWQPQNSIRSVAQQLGYTGERVRQLYNLALDELRLFIIKACEGYEEFVRLKKENHKLNALLAPNQKQLNGLISLDGLNFHEEVTKDYYKRIPIDYTELKTRTVNVCKENKLTSIHDLMKFTPEEFNRLRNSGVGTVRDAAYYLKTIGVSFKKPKRKSRLSKKLGI